MEADIKILEERINNIKERIDKFETQCNDKFEEHRKEFMDNIADLYDGLKEVQKEFMKCVTELKTDFGLFKEDLLKKLNGILIKALVAVFGIFGTSIIGLALWIYFNNLKP